LLNPAFITIASNKIISDKQFKVVGGVAGFTRPIHLRILANFATLNDKTFVL